MHITLNDMLHLKKDKRIAFKEETINGTDVIIVSYMISDNDMWKQPLALETRGITFNKATGECICRPFHKFFNLGENDWSHLSNFDTDVFTIEDKRDGSMLTPVLVNGKICWKTKKSFHSDVAVEASITASLIPGFNRWCESIINNGYTPIFEYTSINNRVVIDYGTESRFTLLAIRQISSGVYIDIDVDCPVNVIQRFKVESLEQFIPTIPSMKGIEGFVITLNRKDGPLEKIKVKTQWYLDNHRVMTDLRERDVVEAALNENLDDIKASVSLAGCALNEIERIERRYNTIMSDIISSTENLVQRMKELPDRKSVALTYKNHSHFGLAIAQLNGKEPDYKKFFRNNHMKVDFSLRVVYNPSFTKDN